MQHPHGGIVGAGQQREAAPDDDDGGEQQGEPQGDGTPVAVECVGPGARDVLTAVMHRS